MKNLLSFPFTPYDLRSVIFHLSCMLRKSYPLTVCLLFACIGQSFGADIPEHLDFAGMRLRIKDDVRKKISDDVDRLSKPSKYADAKLDRIRMYFPLIERVLAEEGVPNEFKYLAIQESDLVADAVSTSNAVGFWQFKRETALEMGLMVNNDVDERKHIVAATRAAARYLKRNNFFFDNWIFSLMAYNTGLTGAKNLIGEGDKGANRMEINNDTHWYVVKFLAHRIAFEKATASGTPSLTLLEYPCNAGQKLSDIASTLNIPEDNLVAYNKWLSSRRIPEDKPYTILAPVPASQADVIAAKVPVPAKAPVQFNYEYNYDVEADARQSAKYPLLKKKETVFYEINGRPGIQAKANDNVTTLAEKANISVDKFLRYNDLAASDAIIPNQVYYLKKKRNKGKLHYHTFVEGETLWQISQKYGLKLQKLKAKNRIADGEKIEHGRVLWLRFQRPSDKPVEIRNTPKPGAKPTQTPIVKAPAKPVDDVVKQPTPVLDSDKPVTEPKIVPVPSTNPPVITPPVVDTAPVIKPVEEKPVVVTLPPTKTDDLTLLRSHQVQAGETLYSIARQYNVSVAQLRQWNNLSETAGLSIGQKLIVGEENTTVNSIPETPKTSTPSVTPAVPSPTEHTVQLGETLYSIARKYGVTVGDLRLWNNLAESDAVKAGQKLLVKPASSTTADTTKTAPVKPAATFIEYEVQPGDTLYKIAKGHGVTVDQLLEWNGKSAPSVSIGEKIKIKK